MAGARDRQDPDFAEDLDKIERLARDKITAIARMTAAERAKLPEELTQMQQSLDKAIKDSDARFTKAEDELITLSDVVKSVWVLPRPLAGVLAKLATEVEGLESILRRRDLPEFQRGLDAALGNYGTRLSTTLREWRRDVRTVLRALPKRVAPRLAADALEVHAACLAELDTKLAEADSLPADRTQVIKHMLTSGHDARDLAEKLLDRVQDSTYVTASGVLGTLTSKASSPLTSRLEHDVNSLHDLELPSLLDEPNVDAFADAASKVTAAMTDVIGSRYPAEPPAGVLKLLAEGKYEEAATQAAAPRRQARRRALASTEELESSEMLGAGEPEVGVTAIRYRSRAWYPRLSEQHRTLLPARRASARVVPLELEIERTAAQIRKDERIQFLLAALGLALLSLLVFGGSFVGTFENCAQVFLWGFTTDIGVNTLVNQAKAVRK